MSSKAARFEYRDREVKRTVWPPHKINGGAVSSRSLPVSQQSDLTEAATTPNVPRWVKQLQLAPRSE